MGIILGIDIGISTTKIVGNYSGECLSMLQFQTAEMPQLLDSLHNGIDGLLRKHELRTSEISDIYLTGVGASFVIEQVCGVKVQKVQEFDAMRNGALKLSGLEEALIISIGTGTSFVRVTREENGHIGGTGVGGGTVIGLASKLLSTGSSSDTDASFETPDIFKVLSLAEHGDIRKVDLSVGDVLCDTIDTLPAELTASNFGKIGNDATQADIALGIINMVFETIGMMALFALQRDRINDIVIIGTLAGIPQAKQVFDNFAKLTGKNFIILPDAAFVTALGTLPAIPLFAERDKS